MKTIKINRAKWITGGDGKYSTGKGSVKLFNKFSNKCCLGFITCQVSKRSTKLIKDTISPGDLNFSVKFLNQLFLQRRINTEISNKAMDINDNEKTTPQKKEKQLKKLFKGKYNLEFFGEYNYQYPDLVKMTK